MKTRISTIFISLGNVNCSLNYLWISWRCLRIINRLENGLKWFPLRVEFLHVINYEKKSNSVHDSSGLYLRSVTVCPGSSDPILYSELLYKTGHYFLDIRYFTISRADNPDFRPAGSVIFSSGAGSKHRLMNSYKIGNATHKKLKRHEFRKYLYI